jgi:hypothetical protein
MILQLLQMVAYMPNRTVSKESAHVDIAPRNLDLSSSIIVFGDVCVYISNLRTVGEENQF